MTSHAFHIYILSNLYRNCISVIEPPTLGAADIKICKWPSRLYEVTLQQRQKAVWLEKQGCLRHDKRSTCSKCGRYLDKHMFETCRWCQSSDKMSNMAGKGEINCLNIYKKIALFKIPDIKVFVVATRSFIYLKLFHWSNDYFSVSNYHLQKMLIFA